LKYNKTYPKKSLGQNYLIDENICRNIVDSFDINPDDKIIEIGPGQGAITKFILKKSNNYTGVEIDNNNITLLYERYPDAVFIKMDFLKYDLSLQSGLNNKIRVLGNIPYNITTDIIFMLIDNRKIVQDAQLMIQEEVARRLTAQPNSKEYGIPSVFAQVFSKPELKFKVSRNCFYPKPNVDSRIIYFDFSVTKETEINDIIFFKKFVKAAFGNRRKTLRNSLKGLELDLGKADLDFSRRAETLSVDEFIKLSNIFSGT